MASPRHLRYGEAGRSVPCYDMRVWLVGLGWVCYEVWQVSSAGIHQIQKPVRIAGLQGRSLHLVQHRVLCILAVQRIRLVGIPGHTGFSRPLPKTLAVWFGLMFLALATVHDCDRMWTVVVGIEKMEREEVVDWPGMAIHREHPRRDLAGLWILLAESAKERRGDLSLAASEFASNEGR